MSRENTKRLTKCQLAYRVKTMGCKCGSGELMRKKKLYKIPNRLLRPHKDPEIYSPGN